MARHTVILGMQWGDEGKGKVVDLLTPPGGLCLRVNGGANAGHTIRRGDRKLKVHQLPSGVYTPEVMNVIGPGCVVTPSKLLAEIEEVTGILGRTPQLRISDRAHVVLQTHITQDRKQELDRSTPLGTTLSGNGPAYADKYARRGAQLGTYMRDLQRRDSTSPLMALMPYVADVNALLRNYGGRILVEGAHGFMLDIDHGAYPFVTSSHCGLGGAISGSGLSLRDDTKVIGVAKAYSTRIAAGPFPSEIHNHEMVGEIRRRGEEFGTTTGRERRIGWLDLPALRYAVQANGVDSLVINMIDVLAGLGRVELVIAYDVEHNTITIPQDVDLYSRLGTTTMSLPGWKPFDPETKSYKSLPIQVHRFIRVIEDYVRVPVSMVGISPKTLLPTGNAAPFGVEKRSLEWEL